jgi:multiple sugar transport system permease protein
MSTATPTRPLTSRDAEAAASATGSGVYPYLMIAPTMLTLVVVGLVPFLCAVFFSLHEMKYGRLGAFVGLGNYLKLLTDARFLNCLWVALVFVGVAVPLEFVLGLVGALILNRRVLFRRIIVPLLFVPTMIAPVVVGLIWKIMLAGSWGLLSYNVIERFGWLPTSSIFASPRFALYALIFVDVWQWTPFMVVAFFAGLQALPVNPYRAAAIDGAGARQIFFRLTLPMLTPLLVVIGLLRLIDAFKVFDSIFILTGGGPGIATESPSIFAFKTTFEFWEIGEASALAVLIWLLFFAFCNVFYQVAKTRLKAF